MKEENTAELFDYISVIWRRKILIIVMTLVCLGIGAGVNVKNSRSKPPPVTSYTAEAIVKVGRKVLFTPASGVSSTVAYVESPEFLKVTLPLKHGFGAKDTLGYHLKVKRMGQTSMIKLSLVGSDMEVERLLKEIVDLLVEEHRVKTESSMDAYTHFIKKLEADSNIFQENITAAEANIIEIKRRGGAHLEDMVASEAKVRTGRSEGGQSAFMNMLYLKTIDIERDLKASRNDLRNAQWQLIMYQTSIGDRRKYNTEMFGAIKSTAVTPKGKRTQSALIVAGIVGLMMSLFIAFFMEYIEESKSRRKGK